MSQRSALDPEEELILGGVPKRGTQASWFPSAPIGPPCPNIVPARLNK